MIKTCLTFHGLESRWFGGQTCGTAARHHDPTGHPNWSVVLLSVPHGRRDVVDDRQIAVETKTAGAVP